jgi:hypothetical protein
MEYGMKRIVTCCAVMAAVAWSSGSRAQTPATGPATTQAASQATTQEATVEITMDTSEVPELKEWADKLQPVLVEWYPKIAAMLPSDGYEPPKRFTVTFKDMDGVAFTAGTHVVCAKKWFLDHPDDGGAIVHELVHVVQQYHHRSNPSWLVEGIADYVRWFNYEPKSKWPRPHASRAKYDASYQTTAAFLYWATEKYDKDLVKKLNVACRQGKYKESLWQDYTGKTVQDLGDEWKESLRK